MSVHLIKPQEVASMAIKVRAGAHTVSIDAPEGMTLGDLLIEVQKDDVNIGDNVTATIGKTVLEEDDLVLDNSRVVLATPAGEKG